MKYMTNVERFAEARGFEKGQAEVAIKVLMRLLQRQFNEVPEEVQTRLQTLSVGQLEGLIDMALSAESLAAFVDRLPQAKPIELEA
jgi:Domain of unknown function (DUF4351)